MAIALMTGAMGCSVDILEVEQEESLKIVFDASPFLDGDSDVDTRTSVVPNETYTNYEFIWSAKDTVGIYPDAGSQIFFTMENGAGASSATFDGGAWTCKEGHTFRSYYPFIGNIYLDATKIPVSFTGQKQVGNNNSDHFQKYDYMYTAATTKDSGFLNFSYSHLITAVLPWVELPAGHYTGLTLSLKEALFVTEGEYDLTAANPAIVGKKYSNSMSIELDVTFTAPDILKVYVPLAPMDMSGKKLTITITDEDGREFQYTYEPSKPYVASKIYRLRSAISFVDASISFADDAVKALCVANWDTDSNGELSFAEAAAVTTLFMTRDSNGQSIFAGSSITSFNELVNFTGLTSIEDHAFEGCSALTSITLPKRVTSIGESAFSGCKNLTDFSIPDGVTEIGTNAFDGCAALTSVTIPMGVTSIDDYAYAGCENIFSITIPYGVTNVGKHAFEGCLGLSEITLPETVTNIGESAFEECETLTSINIPSGVTKINNATFASCQSLSSIIIPFGVTSIGERAFDDCTNLTGITVLPTTPPTGGNQMFVATNNCPIYVPAESVDAYKSAEYWSDYADRIQVIPYINGHEFVDMGAAGKWATMNVGAGSPEGFGDYFAWGETSPKENYYSTNYSFTGDLMTLPAENDAATANWGSPWRTPTEEEWALLGKDSYYTWIWTKENGVNGYKVTSKSNGNSIFLPASGFSVVGEAYISGLSGYYWSSSRNEELLEGNAGAFSIVSDQHYLTDFEKYGGLTVRPVSD